jgi:hypothetical protein
VDPAKHIKKWLACDYISLIEFRIRVTGYICPMCGHIQDPAQLVVSAPELDCDGRGTYRMLTLPVVMLVATVRKLCMLAAVAGREETRITSAVIILPAASGSEIVVSLGLAICEILW